jgi:hypothetical protein
MGVGTSGFRSPQTGDVTRATVPFGFAGLFIEGEFASPAKQPLEKLKVFQRWKSGACFTGAAAT